MKKTNSTMLETNCIEWHGVTGSRCYILVKFHEIANSTLKISKYLKIFPTIIRIKKNIVIFSLSLGLGFGLFFK